MNASRHRLLVTTICALAVTTALLGLSGTTRVSALNSADLGVTKSDSPDPVAVGQNVTYTIVVTNHGPDSATTVTLTDTLPAGVLFVSATPSQGNCSELAGAVTCTFANLASDAAATVTIVITTVLVGEINNTASVTVAPQTDPVSGNNSASATTTVGASADVGVTKTDSPDPALAGENVTYTIVVSNSGPDSATVVTLTDALPAGVTFVSAMTTQGGCSQSTGTVTCVIGTLANGASATVTIVITPTAPGAMANTATVSATEADVNPANNSAAASTTVSADADGDAVPDAVDNCPAVSNQNQANSDGDMLGDACDNCPATTNQGQENLDGDPYGDLCDNCLAWGNPAQALPQWPVPADDPDCDGYGTSIENYVGTNASLHCGTNAWPADFDDSTDVALSDVLQIKPHMHSTVGLPGGTYSPEQFLAADMDETQALVISNGTAVLDGDVIQIDSEQIKVTLGGGTSVLDVVRGYNGTTPAPHLSAGGTNPIYRVTYDRRFDLNGDGQIRLQDVLLMKPFFSLTCT